MDRREIGGTASLATGELRTSTVTIEGEAVMAYLRFASVSERIGGRARANEAPSQRGFRVIEVQAGDSIRLIPAGELDLATAGAFEEACRAAFARVRAITIDLAKLEFMDSTGLRSLLAAQQAAERDGLALTLRRCPDPVQRVLRITGVIDRFRWS